ncbi:hypothetical protein GCM10007390_40090 [Persicitalea jodogahamensis]|uniref:Glycosyltransferase n=2 Tax=Persicitalea jodogahamensis TaxID=402147 RepID=A0A8J3GAA0_9BACT|nr:hypothetical protein GCM10007390_40090 [Persicitalea jodogahamensis]
MASLQNLDFPKDQFEVLIGNDQSEDQTENIILNYIQDKSTFQYHLIDSQTPGLRGKANVLAQLAHYAKGQYLFYCDADIAVAPGWLNEMLALFNVNTGVVVGVTRMTPTGVFAAMQSIEWLFSLTAMRFFSHFEIPFTGMGNNMAVRREAYFAVGGYENIGFSIVEDFALFMAILSNGYGFVQGFQPGIISTSQPTQTLSELLTQRKRWVKGAMQAPWQIKSGFFASALFLPMVISLIFIAPSWSIGLALAHFLLVTVVGLTGLTILKQRDLFKYLPLFWFYFNLNNTLMLINYLRPSSTVWKGRSYE